MDSIRPKRRPRYKGTHPRQFHEKYKELKPELYPDETKKAKESGKTPAGSHRPICVAEILEILNPQPGHRVVDGTLGFGEHSSEILPKILPGGVLLGFDLDPEELPKTEARLRAKGYSSYDFKAVPKNFVQIPEVLNSYGLKKVDLVLADLGVSSMQLDNPARGFSFKNNGPLDLRMNPKIGKSAAHFLSHIKEQDLAEILENNADEVFAQEIAKVIVRIQKQKPIKTTEALADAVNVVIKTLPPRVQKEQGTRPIRRVFQALRIAVNNEFESLETFLIQLPEILVRGGKVAILTFHSGEDRRVKKSFQAGYRTGYYSDIAQEVIRPKVSEVLSNPRASSAKLRWAIRS